MSQHRANYKKAPIFLGLERTRKKSSADWKRTSTSEYYQDALGYTRQQMLFHGHYGLAVQPRLRKAGSGFQPVGRAAHLFASLIKGTIFHLSPPQNTCLLTHGNKAGVCLSHISPVVVP